MQPILYQWQGDGWAPANSYWARQADAEFAIGERRLLDTAEERSEVSHRHEFAWLKEAWLQLPESLADQYPSPKHLRKRALIQGGFFDEQIVDAGSNAAALRVAAAFRSREEFSLVIVRGAFVVIRTAKSQSRLAMKAAEFQASKTAVLEIVSDLIGVEPSQLQRETGKAA